MFEAITKGVVSIVLKPGPDGTAHLQPDVLIGLLIMVGLVVLYKYQLRPLFKKLDELVPQWQARAERLDRMIEAHGTVQVRLNELVDQLETIDSGTEQAEKALRELASQLLAAEQSITSGNRHLHSDTKQSLLEWLERSEDRTAQRDRQLAVIQSEIRNLSTLLMATSAARYNQPLS